MVADSPWLSALRGLAVVCVTLVFCQGLVGLPSWGCDASGFLGPAVFLVFAMGSPVSGWDCILPQVLDRNEDFPSFWWVWFLALVRVPLPLAGAVFYGMR